MEWGEEAISGRTNGMKLCKLLKARNVWSAIVLAGA